MFDRSIAWASSELIPPGTFASSQSFIVSSVEGDRIGLRLVVEVPADSLVVLLEPVQHDREVGEDLVTSVEGPVEPVVVAGAGRERLRLGVDERDVQLLRQAADLVVTAVDVLPAVLRRLRVVEDTDRPAASPTRSRDSYTVDGMPWRIRR